MLILFIVHKVNRFLFETVKKVGTIRLEEWVEQQIILLEVIHVADFHVFIFSIFKHVIN